MDEDYGDLSGLHLCVIRYITRTWLWICPGACGGSLRGAERGQADGTCMFACLRVMRDGLYGYGEEEYQIS